MDTLPTLPSGYRWRVRTDTAGAVILTVVQGRFPFTRTILTGRHECVSWDGAGDLAGQDAGVHMLAQRMHRALVDDRD